MAIDIDKLYGIHNKMLDSNILLAYKGEFNRETVDTLLLNTKKQMKNLSINVPISKKIYNITVECLENIHKHAGSKDCEKEPNPHYPLFVMGKSDKSYYITAGNLICKKDINVLKQKLDEIKRLDRDKLKEKYRETLMKSEFSDRGGVGIIDMALKSDNKLEYIFKTIEGDIAFFVLEIKISLFKQ